MEAKFTFHGYDFTFSDSDVVNPADYIPAGTSNYHNVRPWALFHEFGIFAVVFASCEQEALDIAADSGKLDTFKAEEPIADEDVEGVSFLGNYGTAYRLGDYFNIHAMPNPPFSFAAIFMAMQAERAPISA